MTNKQFRANRQRLGLTQDQLGRIMDTKQQAITRIEGERGPTKIHAAFLRVLLLLGPETCQKMLVNLSNGDEK